MDENGCILGNCDSMQYFLSTVIIDEEQEKLHPVIYPNPLNSNVLYVQYERDIDAEIYIHDLHGRQVVQCDLLVHRGSNMTLPDMLPGIYVVTVRDKKSGKRFVSKLVRM